MSFRRSFERQTSSGANEATFGQAVIEEFDQLWESKAIQIQIVPGKEALTALNAYLQEEFDVNITPTAIVDAMTVDEVPKEVRILLADLATFSSTGIDASD